MTQKMHVNDRAAPIEPRPFIIWTLRRTGGTTLAKHLFRLSPFRSTQHEPFNKNRAFADIRAAFEATGDIAALDAICARGVLIKHCVETVPSALSHALMECSTTHGYRHLFLVRRDPGDRLLSLHFARVSGVWGARQMVARDLDDLARIMRETPIPINDLLKREESDRARLQAFYDRAEASGQRPLIGVFEDLYDYANPSVSLARLGRLEGALGLGAGADGDEGRRQALFGGGQRTRDIYELAPGHAAFRAAVAEVPPMTFQTPPNPDPVQWADFTVHPGCDVDPPRQSWRSDLVQITGTARPSEGWQMQLADGAVLPMETGLSLAPGARNAAGTDATGFAVLDVPRARLRDARFVAQPLPVRSADLSSP